MARAVAALKDTFHVIETEPEAEVTQNDGVLTEAVPQHIIKVRSS